MGHTRLGEIPKSRKWKDVVAFMTNAEFVSSNPVFRDEVEMIAVRTLDAAETGIEKALDDLGLRYSFYLLTQLALASREDNWEKKLTENQINVSRLNSTFELITEIQTAIDDYIFENGRATDISEMAQQSIGETISKLVEPKANTLFGSGKEEIQSAIKSLSTKKGFADLGQKFFGHFMTHYLNFFLSRVTAAQVGTGRFRSVEDVTKFNQVLQTHCEQTAKIVRDYCGEWYSKTEYMKGIDLENTSEFISVALKKLKSELKKQKFKT